MLVTHDALAMFGYGFGDLEALTRMDFNWLVVPVMGGVGACSVFFWFSVTNEYSCLCRTGFLCIPNLHTVKVSNCPRICHLRSLP